MTKAAKEKLLKPVMPVETVDVAPEPVVEVPERVFAANEFPMMLKKHSGYSLMVVTNPADLEKALADGWNV